MSDETVKKSDGALVNWLRTWVYRLRPYRGKFRGYYMGPGWNCPASKSGPGSTMAATSALREVLPQLISRYGIHTVHDVGCGDFKWMRTVDLSAVRYTGFDIVPEMIERNQAQFGKDGLNFQCLDFVRDPIPKADLIICRDCCIHYNNRRILRTLQNIRQSGATYLLTTTFPKMTVNEDLFAVGWYRPINLQLPPFKLPPPLELVEEFPEQGKSCGLWRIDALPPPA